MKRCYCRQHRQLPGWATGQERILSFSVVYLTGSTPFYWVSGNRGDGIRTHDLCVPNAALYQTEPRLDLYIRKTRMTAFAVSKCHNTKPRMRCQQENFTLGRPSLTQWPSWENFRSVTVMTTATAPEEISIAMPTMVKVLTKPSASTIMPPKRLLMIEAAPP